MFESLLPDRAQDAQTRATRIFYVVAVFNVLTFALAVLLSVSGVARYRLSYFIAAAVSAPLAFLVGRGIASGKKWSRWLGYALALLMVREFPVGTVVGIALFIYLTRAAKLLRE